MKYRALTFLAMASVLSTSVVGLTSCGGAKVADDTNTLQIFISDFGSFSNLSALYTIDIKIIAGKTANNINVVVIYFPSLYFCIFKYVWIVFLFVCVIMHHLSFL